MHPPDDKRVHEKEARSLANAGFEVVHIAPGDGREWVADDVRIITFSQKPGLWNRFTHLARLYRLALKTGSQVYHCNEVDSWLVGVALRILAKKKCIFDVHEHYPEEFAETRFPRWARPIVKRIVSSVIWTLSWFTSCVVLAKPSLRKGYKHLPEERTCLVQNFAPVKNFGDVNGRGNDSDNKPLKMIHLGLFNRHRGWPQLLNAMAQAECQDTELLVLGTINDGSSAEFKSELNRLGLSKRVYFKSWLPFDQAMLHVKSSDIGLIIFQPGLFNHVHAFPHKMFDYMGAGIALIAPDLAVDVAEIVNTSQCGILVDSSDSKSIAAAIDRLNHDRKLLRELGENGRQAVVNHYNWEAEANKLVDLYRKFEREIA